MDWTRLGKFVAIAIPLEILRLALFVPFETFIGTNLANIASLFISTFCSFFLHLKVTWKDRKDRTRAKLFRFATSKALLVIVGSTVFPIFGLFPFLSCPFAIQVNWLIEVIQVVAFPLGNFLKTIVDCNFLSATLMDLTIGLSLAFWLHNHWSFKEDKLALIPES